MKLSISSKPYKESKSDRKARTKVYIVIAERDWIESIKGISFDRQKANRHKYKIERQLERLKWDDFNRVPPKNPQK